MCPRNTERQISNIPKHIFNYSNIIPRLSQRDSFVNKKNMLRNTSVRQMV